MIRCTTGKRKTWKALHLLPPAETKKQLERQDSLDTVKSTNVLQCSIPCADMWYETDRQAVHADRQIMQRGEESDQTT